MKLKVVGVAPPTESGHKVICQLNMPNSKILPDVEGESADTPKKFRNIDIEEFHFWWNGKPLGGIFTDRMTRREEEVTLSDGKKDIKVIYDFVKGIMPNEVVTMPKYLVNYAAMHLARKMYKRKMFEGKSEAERSIGIVRTVNPEEEFKLQKQMVADNFPEINKDNTGMPEFFGGIKAIPIRMDTSSTTVDPPSTTGGTQKQDEVKSPEPEGVSFKCDLCGFIAKNNVGLSAHKRRKHKI